MRVTQSILFDSARFFINRNSRRLLAAQERVATQKNINRISDDPVQAPRLLDIKTAKSRIIQFIRNIERVDSLANVYDTTTGQAESLIVRVKELLLGEANEITSTPATREAARIEIAAITSQLAQIANTRFDGKYIFSGFSTNTEAIADTTLATSFTGSGGATITAAIVTDDSQLFFDQYQIVFTDPSTYDIVRIGDGAAVITGGSYTSGQPISFDGLEVTITDGGSPPAAGDDFRVTVSPAGAFLGDNGRQRVEVQEGTFVQQNLTGDRVFGGVGISGGVDIFDVLARVNTALRANDQTAINGLLTDLDSSRSQLDGERAAIGARQNLIQNLLDRHGDLLIGLETIRSEIEDADLADVLTRLTQEQNAFEASIGAAAQIIDISLLDFLR